MKSTLKNIFFVLVGFFPSRMQKSASILMYHSVSENGLFFSVSPYTFEKQLAYLKREKYSVIKLSELIARIKKHKDISKCVVITFDDGYRDNYADAFPLLQKYSFPATIFLATHFVESERDVHGVTIPMLTKAQITEMVATGSIEFMPHTQTHLSLREDTPLEVAIKEVVDSSLDVERLTGARAAIFSYPKGRVNVAVDGYLRENGWDGAVTVEEGLVTPKSDIFLLCRNSVDSATSMAQFKGKVSRAIDVYIKLKKFFK